MTEQNDKQMAASSWATADFKSLTQARIALGRFGGGVPTRAAQSFLLDHAKAKAAVWSVVDFARLRAELEPAGLQTVIVSSRATDRATYVRRPDLGRQLSEEARQALSSIAGTTATAGFDVTIVIADGLSASAVEENAPPLALDLAARFKAAGLRVSPLVLVSGGRVAIGDEIAEIIGSKIVVVLIGERPGLSASDSLGAYITYGARPGTPDSARNCVSNIRAGGLSIAGASANIAGAVPEMIAAEASGVRLALTETVTLPSA